MAGKKTIWDLALELTGDTSKASVALQNVQKQIQAVRAASNKFNADFAAFASNAGKLAAGAAAVATGATAALVAGTKSVAEAGNEAYRASQRIGMGAESFQALHFALGQGFTDASELNTALEKFNIITKQAAAGNEAMQKQLDAVGMSAKDLVAMGPEKAFLHIADVLKSLPDTADQARLAMTLFGKQSGQTMAAALGVGSEAIEALMAEGRKYGNYISDDMAAASNDYLTQMGNIKTAMSGLKTQFFGASVIPMTGAFVTLSEAIAANGPLAQDLGKKLGEFVTKAIQKLPEIIAYLKEFGEKVWENITRVKDFVGGWKNLAVGIGVLVSLKTALSGVQAALSGAKLAKEAFTLALKTGQAVVGGVKTAYGLLTGSMSVMKAASEGNKLALLMLNAQMVKAKVIAIANKTAMIAMAAAQKVAAAAQWLLNAAMSANPIGLIIAGITALIAIIVLLVKNWDTVKEAALKTWDAILGAVIKAGESIKNVFLGVIEWVKSNWQSIVAFIINPFAGAFKYLYDNFEGFRNIVNNVVGAIVGFFLAGFDAIKQKLTAFVEFFTSKFASIKDFFGGVGSKVGGAFEKIKSILPGRAEGGIFTHRHIAEIAERGAEAIIPLNKSPGGFDIWKRAGEMGGYLQQAQTATTRAGMSQPRTSPVMRAASQKMSGGDSPFTMTATFNITVNGGGSDKETVENIRKGVGQAADDFKEKWIRTFEEFNRDNRRVSFA